MALGACGRNQGPGRPPAVEELEAALTPRTMAQALRKAGGGHFHAVVSMTIDTPAADGQPALKDEVTTTTDLWMDGTGNYRLLETNDRDGGREIVLHGRQLAVALRYSRMIRRPMQEGEGARFLEEALGGPIGAWAIARRFAEVARQEDAPAAPPPSDPNAPPPPPSPATFEVKRASEVQPVKGDFESGVPPLQRWRETVDVQALTGKVRLEGPTLLPAAVQMEAKFSLTRDGKPLTGMIRVDSKIQELGRVAAIEPPLAEELPARQRTILEERALLGPRTGGTEPARRPKAER
ncbi:MAG TPA: hypothetical protein VGG33_25715 [Polyangia bacterium]